MQAEHGREVSAEQLEPINPTRFLLRTTTRVMARWWLRAGAILFVAQLIVFGLAYFARIQAGNVYHPLLNFTVGFIEAIGGVLPLTVWWLGARRARFEVQKLPAEGAAPVPALPRTSVFMLSYVQGVPVIAVLLLVDICTTFLSFQSLGSPLVDTVLLVISSIFNSLCNLLRAGVILSAFGALSEEEDWPWLVYLISSLASFFWAYLPEPMIQYSQVPWGGQLGPVIGLLLTFLALVLLRTPWRHVSRPLFAGVRLAFILTLPFYLPAVRWLTAQALHANLTAALNEIPNWKEAGNLMLRPDSSGSGLTLSVIPFFRQEIHTGWFSLPLSLIWNSALLAGIYWLVLRLLAMPAPAAAERTKSAAEDLTLATEPASSVADPAQASNAG